MKNLSVISTLFLLMPMAQAHVSGFGNDALALTDVPNAVCKVITSVDTSVPDSGLTETTQHLCTGTIVVSPAFVGAKIVTAGHCFGGVDLKKASIKANCGCTDKSCAEKFTLNEVKFIYDASHDHAMLSLDHAPKKIIPLSMTSLKDIATPECIKGGFGRDKSGVTTTVPNLFSTVDHPFEFYASGAAPDSDQLIGENFIKVDWTEEFAKKNFGKFSDDLVNNEESFEKTLAINGVINNILQHGDSGSGLLCRSSKDALYSLAGIYLGSNESVGSIVGEPPAIPGGTPSPDKITSVYISDRYFSIPPEWLKKAE